MKPLYYDVGSFRVHGPYITEKGEDTKRFVEKQQAFILFEKKLQMLAATMTNKKIAVAYTVALPLNHSMDFIFSAKNGQYDVCLYDKTTNEFRCDIKPSEFDLILQNADKLLNRSKASIVYETYIEASLVVERMRNSEYCKAKYDPVVNPVRGSPKREDDELYELD